MSMSSYRTDRFVGVTICKAPPHLSPEEFKTSMEELMARWRALPAVKNHVLQNEMILSNDLLDAHAKAAGMPDPRPTALITGEYESEAQLFAITRDPETQNMVRSAEQYRAERDVCALWAEVMTKIDKPGSKDRIHAVGILNVPQDQSPEEHERRFEDVLDRLVALPATQKCVLKCTVWRQNQNVDNEIVQAVGIPTPQRTFIIRFEYESQDRMMEVLFSFHPSYYLICFSWWPTPRSRSLWPRPCRIWVLLRAPSLVPMLRDSREIDPRVHFPGIYICK
ncbi:hypothetical protein DFH07DRAFT_12626 [Mycena maculata]|uniref:Uncharacterized protein n=1 Tax=Mycena maculata TaxID=230809 RepID=A0AAD7K848_9AGAR|nr:hypothetical protein DFH07DRAFT_12626 [Mycena maculata]